jgi:steroid delta-isomerase-like uncharacterized protein
LQTVGTVANPEDYCKQILQYTFTKYLLGVFCGLGIGEVIWHHSFVEKANSRSTAVTVEENKVIAARFYEVYNKGDMELVDELFSPDFVGRDPDDPSLERHGPEGVKRVVEAFRNAFPDLEGTLEDQTAEDDKVVNRYTGRGTHRGEFLGVAPTGREVELSGVTIFRLSGGKIVEGWDFYDGLGLLRQLGAMPASGEKVEPSH